ncbi:hypothetical protein FRX31_028241 [Thalictrum thalictroides]|uniref:CCHC-type domain-containing protein n=1 Tax=Thalictrum thalictroides TaxID=46969 RepID=A0A7J6VBY4_THATH|nr:hypothetical protein FRX31_028241 [Thalictrum thalictroides]
MTMTRSVRFSQVMNCLIVMERFSSPTKPETVVLDKIPLWVNFYVLLLEHLNKTTVQRIASVVGVVGIILLEEGLPKNDEDFRANVKIDINQPLKSGAYVESIEREISWVSFRYPNKPTLHCTKCGRVGHQKHNCNFTKDEKQCKKSGEKMNQQLMGQDSWPHEHVDDTDHETKQKAQPKIPHPETVAQSQTNSSVGMVAKMGKTISFKCGP